LPPTNLLEEAPEHKNKTIQKREQYEHHHKQKRTNTTDKVPSNENKNNRQAKTPTQPFRAVNTSFKAKTQQQP